MDTLEGTIEKIIFRNENNFYTVARIEPFGEDSTFTVVGSFSSVKVGENYRLSGEWVTHKTYGRQFSFSLYEEILPTSKYGIEKYLGSGMIKGIGPEIARRLVSHFGPSIFDILEDSPEKLSEVKGIGKKTAEKIAASYQSQRQMKNIMTYLAGYDISPSYALKIFQTYGNDCIDVLRKNPYQLAEDIWGIGFKIADKIARKLGLPMDSPFRIRAFVIYLLQEGTNRGHLFLEKDYLMEIAQRDLQVDLSLIENVLAHMVEADKIIFDEEAVYLKGLYQLELNIACKAKLLTEIEPLKGPEPNEISLIEEQINVNLSDSQQIALYEVFSSGLSIITGGPGTGKTTIVKSIIIWAEELGLTFSLGAPTGRAAKRLSEATDRMATTIHRMLGFIPGENDFMHNEDEPLDADIIIIDEASMIDVFLFNSLLKGITSKTRIILVGDIDQLPSVGPGNILSDLIKSGLFKTIYLKTIFRQEKESYIILNSHRINHGKTPILKTEDTDFYFYNSENPEEILNKILTLCSQNLKFISPDPVDSVQVLSPMHKGPIGVTKLNEELQKILNPPASGKTEVRHGSNLFREGDKVMQVVNNYTKQVFNGDLGRIKEIDREEQILWVELIGDDFVVEYEFGDLSELILAYACTIHKSQGSEYPVVIIPVSSQHYIMLQRNLLYTAVTRARKMVILVGEYRALKIAINNDKISKRNSKLIDRLRAEV